MIVRSIKLVHFRGVPELSLSNLPAAGLVETASPPGIARTVVAQAIRFALLGPAEGAPSVIEDGAGYAYVEVAFRTTRDAQASIFRGVDRRGAAQVSLREEGGMRVTGGELEVRARLEELLGAPPSNWAYATWIEPTPADEDPLPAATGLRRLMDLATLAPRAAELPVPETGASPPLTEARETAERAVDALRRALRSDALRERIDSALTALVDFGARLRRERTDTVVRVERSTAERERVRARLRRVNEYRDLVAGERAAAERAAEAPEERPASRAVAEWALAGCAVVLLCALVFVSTSPASGFQGKRDLQVFLGLGFLFSATCYVGVAGRRRGGGRFVVNALDLAPQPRPATPVPAPGEIGRDALRRRFEDLGDPDDPNMVSDLRSRISALDAEILREQRRLERLDDAVTAFDVESGRAARAAHRPLPAHEEAPSGLLPEESREEPKSLAERFGDAAYHACVERDALLADGTEDVATAATSVRAAFEMLGRSTGRSERAQVVLAAAGLAGGAGADSATLRGDDDLCLRLAEAVEELARPSKAGVPDAETALGILAREALADASVRVGQDVAELLGDAVASISGRQFVLVQVGPRLDLLLQGGADATPVGWNGLTAEVRERLALALRLRLGDKALRREPGTPATPRFVVLEDRPTTFADDAALAEFVRSMVPGVVQVLVPPRREASPGAPTATSPADAAESSSPAAPRRRRRRPPTTS